MQAVYDYLYVTVEKEANDEISFDSGVKLFIDTSFNPEKHATICGTVYSIPQRLSDQPLGFEGRVSDIEPIVEVGDKVYFHYNTVKPENRYEVDGTVVYRLHYSQVFCVARWRPFIHRENLYIQDIIPVGSHVLLEPVYPEGVEVEVIDGVPVGVKKIGNIVIESNIQPYQDRGKIAHIGEPLANQSELPYKTGDTVMLSKYSDFRNTIEGVEYYVVKQIDILGLIE
jgi:co-chaperonin GroES (HSP10)